MYDILELNKKLVSDLRAIAKELNIKKSDTLKKQDLIYQILDHQAIAASSGKKPEKKLFNEQPTSQRNAESSNQKSKNTEKIAPLDDDLYFSEDIQLDAEVYEEEEEAPETFYATEETQTETFIPPVEAVEKVKVLTEEQVKPQYENRRENRDNREHRENRDNRENRENRDNGNRDRDRDRERDNGN